MSTWQICKVRGSSRITCNPRSQPQSACTQSHTVYDRVIWCKQCCTCWVCLQAVPSWKGWCHTPSIPVLLWKQGSHSIQWEGGDYDVCLCVWINQTVVSIWQCVDWGRFLISSLKEGNTVGSYTRIKQTHTARPIKDQQSNFPIEKLWYIYCCASTCVLLCVPGFVVANVEDAQLDCSYFCCCDRNISIIFISRPQGFKETVFVCAWASVTLKVVSWVCVFVLVHVHECTCAHMTVFLI